MENSRVSPANYQLSSIDYGLSCSTPACPEHSRRVAGHWSSACLERSRRVTASHNSSKSHTYGPTRNDVQTNELQTIWNHIVTLFFTSKSFRFTSLQKTGGGGYFSTGFHPIRMEIPSERSAVCPPRTVLQGGEGPLFSLCQILSLPFHSLSFRLPSSARRVEERVGEAVQSLFRMTA